MRPSSADNRTVRLFFRSNRVCNGLQGLIRGCFEGAWLGLLCRERLNQLDEAYYQRQLEYVDETYNRQGLFSWEISAVEAHFAGLRRIAVTSAGGGREVLALSKAGYEAVGFEPNAKLADFGTRLLEADCGGARIEVSPRDIWPPSAIGFDGAIVGWGGYMLIAGRRQRVAFLREAAAELPRGAPILLSFYVRNGGSIRFRAVTAVANPLRRLLRRERIDTGDALVPNAVHFFTRDELSAELTDGGFELVDFGDKEYGWAVARNTSGQCAASEQR